MTDKLIDLTLATIFSVPSLFIHVLVFISQFVFHIDQNAITNYISWEAIFLAIMLGIQMLRHHEVILNKKEK
jgi:hypothetical protein